MDTLSVVRVGIAEGAIVKKPQKIRTNGLGSCVGVVLYDSAGDWSGLVHVMLPEVPKDKQVNPAKFADVGVPWLLDRLYEAGANRRRVQAKIAGGAQMFAPVGSSDLLRIGPRNVEMVRHVLTELNIPLVAQDVGGSQGRTIEFDPVTSMLSVRTALRGTYEI